MDATEVKTDATIPPDTIKIVEQARIEAGRIIDSLEPCLITSWANLILRLELALERTKTRARIFNSEIAWGKPIDKCEEIGRKFEEAGWEKVTHTFYTQAVDPDPNPKKVSKKGSVWTTIFHMLFRKRKER